MPCRKKKKFIDKKNAITFSLVHRSQRDPLIVDENAPQQVLCPVQGKRKDDREKFGIYFDDDYDYMQHLKERSEGDVELVEVGCVSQSKIKNEKKVNLPSSLFESEVAEKVGLMNRNAPKSGLQLDLDPDIVAAMDEDFNYSDPENELEDDFVALANGVEGSDEEYDDVYEDDDDLAYSDMSDQFSDMEQKTKFTEYSMSSAVIPRTEQLTMLDDRFEEMYAEYDDNEIGALDCEEIEGELEQSSNRLKEMATEFEEERKKVIEDEKPIVSEHYKYIASDSDSDEMDFREVKKKSEWDCESILSTNSTLYNHPKLISAPPGRIKVSSKTGIPILNNKLTASALAKLDDGSKPNGPGSLASILSTLSVRPKDEKPEERNSRKKAFREFKKERRIEKKSNTLAFKEEKKRLEKVVLNNNKIKHQIPI